MEYIINRLVKQVGRNKRVWNGNAKQKLVKPVTQGVKTLSFPFEIQTNNPQIFLISHLNQYALIKAQSKDYVKETQIN